MSKVIEPAKEEQEHKEQQKRKEHALLVVERLKQAYPETHCSLQYENAWQLLVSVRLAAQCSDARVNIVMKELLAKYPSVQALSEAQPEGIEAIVHSCGLGKTKARDIHSCMKILHEKYHDQVPDTMEELLALPGVGRKSANLILGDVFGKPAIVVDTHCIRLVNRIGLIEKPTRDPVKIEKELKQIIPPEESNAFCHRLVDHGRSVCTARNPRCEEGCCLWELCQYGQEEKKSRDAG